MTRLEKITHILLIVVCVVSLTVLVKNGFFRAASPAELSEKSLVGKTEASLVPAVWSASERNVVLLLGSQCHYCTESMPLYQKLTALRQQERNHFSLLAMGREAPAKLREYLSQNKVNVDDVLQVPSGFAGVNFTPAVFVVDSHGVIQKAFLGKLNSIQEIQLLRIVKKTPVY